ncbi:MAG: hypothetical protein P4L31_03910 [Candidatus Babeliales bacterium]|nr:hypothetical protein [Candidatus Babeliales bacterium]
MAINRAYRTKSNVLLSILALFVVGGLCLTGANALYAEQQTVEILQQIPG